MGKNRDAAALPMPPKRPSPRDVGFYYSLAQIGLEMVAPIGLGVVIDLYFNTLPWATIITAVLGPVAGFLHLISMLNRRQQTDLEKKDQDSQ
jgi:F0F1-type ATP synthase assembly protein I